jgi:hypothetical protein
MFATDMFVARHLWQGYSVGGIWAENESFGEVWVADQSE